MTQLNAIIYPPESIVLFSFSIDIFWSKHKNGALEKSDILQKSNGIFGKNAPLHSVLDIQIVPQQHHAKFLQRGGDRVGPRFTEDAESSDTNPSPKILLQKAPTDKGIEYLG